MIFLNGYAEGGCEYPSQIDCEHEKAFTETDTGFTTSEDGVWRFGQFGNTLIATNYADNPQKFVLGTSTEWEDLGGSPPKARHIAIVRGFVMLGNLVESGTGYQNRVRWSGLDNSETWSASQTTLSDFQDFVGSGGERRNTAAVIDKIRC